jgi:spore germination cell wall hydrolase CwlJ-like protein
LARQSKWRNISEVTFEEGDRYLLANLIYCEAGGEPYEGQVAVGAVVINRLLSSRYPDTVTGVIYQRKQFSPVQLGMLANALAVNKATASCYRAADEAMAGVSNVGNCLYFRTPIPGLTGIAIGGHIFY